MKLKQFNINDSIYVEITEEGWKHLRETVGEEYIKSCIAPQRYVINGVERYRLQCYEAFELMPTRLGSNPLFKTTILIGEEHLK